MNTENLDENIALSKLEKKQKDWDEVEELVLLFQKQFKEDCCNKTKIKSQHAAEELIKRFDPFLNKYLNLFKTGQIDFNDAEMKSFIYTFINDSSLQKALKRKKQKSTYRNDIYIKFNFIKETYGSCSEEEIIMDIQMLFLTLAKRYQKQGRSFCGYLYNCYKFEMSRHIKKYISNPINISYKNSEYQDEINGYIDEDLDKSYEDNYYEDSMGLPDMGWISGENCSDIFACLSKLERKIIVKYYLEECNDRQIADCFGVHINTINQRRRVATIKLAESMGVDPETVMRRRRSGINGIMPT